MQISYNNYGHLTIRLFKPPEVSTGNINKASIKDKIDLNVLGDVNTFEGEDKLIVFTAQETNEIVTFIESLCKGVQDY